MNDYLGFETIETNRKNDLIYDNFSKESLFTYHMKNFSKKLNVMFDYKNLPKTFDKRVLELQTQRGFVIIFKYNGKLYSTYGALGGMPDYMYRPSIATIANPALKLSKTFRIYWGDDFIVSGTENLEPCVIIPNDSLFLGTNPVNSYYAKQLIDNDLTMHCNLVNLRLMNVLIAKDQDAYDSLTDLIKDLEDGKISSALDEDIVTDGVKSTPFGNGHTSTIVQLLEERQYIKGSWWNEFGVQSNYNMKRETITSSENILNIDNLLPASDDMLISRQNGYKLVNELFGENIEVDFSSSWKKLRKELSSKEKILEKEANGLDDKSNQIEKDEGDLNDDMSNQIEKDDKGDGEDV